MITLDTPIAGTQGSTSIGTLIDLGILLEGRSAQPISRDDLARFMDSSSGHNWGSTDLVFRQGHGLRIWGGTDETSVLSFRLWGMDWAKPPIRYEIGNMDMDISDNVRLMVYQETTDGIQPRLTPIDRIRPGSLIGSPDEPLRVSRMTIQDPKIWFDIKSRNGWYNLGEGYGIPVYPSPVAPKTEEDGYAAPY